MRMRMIAAAVLACGLIGGVVTLGQVPDLPPISSPAEPALSPPPAATNPPPLPTEPPIAPSAEPPQDDPMQVVEAFVERSRKEAEASIEKLTKEAETLRARLQKVEAALERWKAVEQAMREPQALIEPQLEATPPLVPSTDNARRLGSRRRVPPPPAPVDAGEKK